MSLFRHKEIQTHSQTKERNRKILQDHKCLGCPRLTEDDNGSYYAFKQVKIENCEAFEQMIHTQNGYPIFSNSLPERFPTTACYCTVLRDAEATGKADWNPFQTQLCLRRPIEDVPVRTGLSPILKLVKLVRRKYSLS